MDPQTKRANDRRKALIHKPGPLTQVELAELDRLTSQLMSWLAAQDDTDVEGFEAKLVEVLGPVEA